MIKNYAQYYYEFSFNRNYKKGLTLIIIGNFISAFITLIQWYSYGYSSQYINATFIVNENPMNPKL
jgi:ammonia channel protein AmtB